MKKIAEFTVYPLIVGIMLFIITPFFKNIETWQNALYLILCIIEAVLITWLIYKWIRANRGKKAEDRKLNENRLKNIEDKIKEQENKISVLEKDVKQYQEFLSKTTSAFERIAAHLNIK